MTHALEESLLQGSGGGESATDRPRVADHYQAVIHVPAEMFMSPATQSEDVSAETPGDVSAEMLAEVSVERLDDVSAGTHQEASAETSRPSSRTVRSCIRRRSNVGPAMAP